MSFWFSLPSIDKLTVNEGQKYRITFKVNDARAFDVIPDINQPTDRIIPFTDEYRLLIYKTEKDFVKNTVSFSGEVIRVNFSGGISPSTVRSPNVIPVSVIFFGIVALLGITATWLTFSKVETLVENPVIETGVMIVFIFLVFALIMYVKKHSG